MSGPPVIGVVIRTSYNATALEQAIHRTLRLMGCEMNISGWGKEWFRTSPSHIKVFVEQFLSLLDSSSRRTASARGQGRATLAERLTDPNRTAEAKAG
jgi:hypothetical protein